MSTLLSSLCTAFCGAVVISKQQSSYMQRGYAPIIVLQQQRSNIVSAEEEQVVVVRPVTSASDVLELADLRYNEWIMVPDSMTHDNDGGVSRHGFRCATAEICEERSSQGAVAFLARLQQDHSNTRSNNSSSSRQVAVGAAELSPIELQGAVRDSNVRMLYVTDFVTVREYRRRGVARALMRALEEYAISATSTAGADDDFTEVLVRAADTKKKATEESPTRTKSAVMASATSVLLLLHVEPSNHVALNFYRKLQYHENFHHGAVGHTILNVEKLAENAGTTGQLLLGKLLDTVAEPTFNLQQ